MAKLTERYVQNNALKYLKTYYEKQNPNNLIYARTELKTVYKNKPGRADGLLAFKKNNGYIYTVSLEAKSHKTFSSLKNVPLDNRLLLSLGANFLIFSVASWFVSGEIILWLKVFIALLVGIVSSIGITAILFKRQQFDTNGIIEQVKRYPADEKWVAFSVDALNGCNQNENGILVSKAQSVGIGVLVVSSGNKVELKLEAKKPKHTVSKSYIYKYIIHKTIIHFLNATT